ncbi:MAG: transposase [Cyanobacteria bacterium]|nr:transposase [Cyanobacteriota bacterium]
MKRKYRQTSAEIKAKAVLEALQEKEEIAVIAAKYDVHPKNLREWKKKFIEDSASIFENKQEANLKEDLKEKERHIDQLNRTIGEMTVCQNWIKKKYTENGLNWENEPPGFRG